MPVKFLDAYQKFSGPVADPRGGQDAAPPDIFSAPPSDLGLDPPLLWTFARFPVHISRGLENRKTLARSILYKEKLEIYFYMSF